MAVDDVTQFVMEKTEGFTMPMGDGLKIKMLFGYEIVTRENRVKI